MFKALGISTLLFSSLLAAQPQLTAAHDRDDNRNGSRYGSDFRGDRNQFSRQRVPERVSRRDDDRYRYNGYRNNYFQNNYRKGFGDRRYGYYDRFGNWCWY